MLAILCYISWCCLLLEPPQSSVRGPSLLVNCYKDQGEPTLLRNVIVVCEIGMVGKSALYGHRMDKAGRWGAGWRSVGGRSGAGRRSVGRPFYNTIIDSRLPLVMWFWKAGLPFATRARKRELSNPRYRRYVSRMSQTENLNRPPTGARPTSDRPPTDLRSTSDRPPTDLRPTSDRRSTGARPAPDRRPTDLRPTSDQPPTGVHLPPTDLRQTSDRPPTDQPCLGYDPLY